MSDAAGPSGDSPAGEPEGNEPDATDLVGTVLAGRYKVLRRLGVGAMGAVYLGEHMRIGRKDAIKVLRAAMARDPEAIARFTRGARNVSRIRHPNVCTLYDFGDTKEGFHFLAMEFVDGPSLGELLEDQGPLSPDRAAMLTGQIGEALQAAHTLGIIHRDLKPDNIMVAREADGSEQVKVVDFDIARGPAEEEGPAVTRHGFVVGTPEYMSPEQLTGDPLDGRSDVYSMALVLFRMLTGKLPFEGDTAQEIMVQRLTKKPLTLSEAAGHPFSEALEQAVAQGLRRKAADRPDDARTLAQQVQEAVRTGGPAAAAPPPPGGSTQPGATAPPPTQVPSASATGDLPAPSPASQGAGATGATAAPRPSRAAAAEATPVGEGTGRSGILLLAGLGLVVLLMVGGGGAAAYFALGWLGGNDGDSDVTTTAMVTEEADDPGTDSDPEVEPSMEEEAPPTQESPPPATAPQESADPAPQDTEVEAPAPAPATAETPPAATDAPPGLDIDPAEAQSTLFGMFVALGEDDPGPVQLEAMRDTIEAIWEHPEVAQEDRAFAAHVLGLALISMGDSVQGVDWLDEAVRLDPIERYISVRNLHREDGP
jgi:eukaryotic-like serine/threonine-protein kinase